MITNESFETQFSKLKEKYEHNAFKYDDPSTDFRGTVTLHFHGISRKSERHGIYIVRKKRDQEVLYIGKGGTIDSKGSFKDQDIPGRLKNVKDGEVQADDWFRDLLEDKGALLVEYVFLPISESPAFVEAALLQAYLNDHGHLPCKNKSF